MEIAKLYHAGNSMLIAIPVKYRRQLGWIEGTRVALVIEGDVLKIRNLEAHVISTRKGGTTRGPGDVTDVNKRTLLP